MLQKKYEDNVLIQELHQGMPIACTYWNQWQRAEPALPYHAELKQKHRWFRGWSVNSSNIFCRFSASGRRFLAESVLIKDLRNWIRRLFYCIFLNSPSNLQHNHPSNTSCLHIVLYDNQRNRLCLHHLFMPVPNNIVALFNFALVRKYWIK